MALLLKYSVHAAILVIAFFNIILAEQSVTPSNATPTPVANIVNVTSPGQSSNQKDVTSQATAVTNRQGNGTTIKPASTTASNQTADTATNKTTTTTKVTKPLSNVTQAATNPTQKSISTEGTNNTGDNTTLTTTATYANTTKNNNSVPTVGPTSNTSNPETQAPTVVTTQKDKTTVNLTLSTEKANDTATTPTAGPANTTMSKVTTEKDNVTNVPSTENPANSTAVPVPTSANTTKNESVSNASTIKPGNPTTTTAQAPNATTNASSSAETVAPPKLTTGAATVAPTANSTLATNQTEAPTVKQTTTAKPTTQPPTAAPTANPSTTKNKTEAPTTVKQTTPKSMTTHAATDTVTSSKPTNGETLVYINEISVDKAGVFKRIELHSPSHVNMSKYAVAIIDGTDLKVVLAHDTPSSEKTGVTLLDLDTSTQFEMRQFGIGLAVYDRFKISQQPTLRLVKEAGLVDALVIGKDYSLISPTLVSTLTPGMDPFILDPSKYGVEKTITRCSSKFARRTDMFVIADASLGNDNLDKCRHLQDYADQVELQMSVDCALFVDQNDTMNEMSRKLTRTVVKEVNTLCQCGLTSYHVQSVHARCCSGLNFKINFTAASEHRVTEFQSYFQRFRKSTKHIRVEGTYYSFDEKCYQNCCSGDSKPQKHGATKDKDVKVTVAVIVTCLLVFLVIVIIVIVYMRRQKSAVYQFRMSRLDEEDDDHLVMEGGDHDDFVGGQEATFDIKA